MKINTKAEKKFDAVKMMREIRNKIDSDTQGMNFEQLKKYYQNSVAENRKQAGR